MTDGPTAYFILIYDIARRKVDIRSYDDDGVAAAADYTRIERELSATEFDVVLVGADSLETIKRTHASYFSEVPKSEIIEKFLASIGLGAWISEVGVRSLCAFALIQPLKQFLQGRSLWAAQPPSAPTVG